MSEPHQPDPNVTAVCWALAEEVLDRCRRSQAESDDDLAVYFGKALQSVISNRAIFGEPEDLLHTAGRALTPDEDLFELGFNEAGNLASVDKDNLDDRLDAEEG